MAWYGGKSLLGTRPIGRWVLSHLPPVEERQTYVEPFAGMLSVLLNRPPAYNEIVNDSNKLVVNWWRCVREHPDELARLLTLTPYSHTQFYECQDILNSPSAHDDLRLAWAFTVVITQCVGARPDRQSGWARSVSNQMNTRPLEMLTIARRMADLAVRIRLVQLDCRDGLDIIQRVKQTPHAVVYCDPPYSRGGAIYAQDFDADRMIELLSGDVQARVAISGGEDCPWDALGWRKESMMAYTHVTVFNTSTAKRRVEHLWMNYPPCGQQKLDVAA